MSAAAALEQKLVKRLTEFKRIHGKTCANCNAMGPTQVCVDFHTYVCMTCSGIHRELQHKVKGISMSKWNDEEVLEKRTHAITFSPSF
jgi:Arf-GAP domain and FG repeat-containing protein 1